MMIVPQPGLPLCECHLASHSAHPCGRGRACEHRSPPAAGACRARCQVRSPDPTACRNMGVRLLPRASTTFPAPTPAWRSRPRRPTPRETSRCLACRPARISFAPRVFHGRRRCCPEHDHGRSERTERHDHGHELVVRSGSCGCPSHRSHALRTSAADGCVGRSERGESDVAYGPAHLWASGIRGDQTSASAGPDPADVDLGHADLRRHAVIQMLHPPKRVEPDGRFRSVGFPAGRYLISASAPFQSRATHGVAHEIRRARGTRRCR